MAYSSESNMRPEKGDSFIMLPITFDYSGGRSDTNKKNILYAVAIQIVATIIGFGIIFSKSGNFIINLLLGIGLMYLSLYIIRQTLLHEGTLKKQYSEYESCDYEANFSRVWGIYSSDEEYPYFQRFRNGSTGLFIRLNKDVVLGKYSDCEYDHYEAIGDAYNVAGASNIRMYHVDYMGVIGSDYRLQESFLSLANVQNTDLKNVLLDTFGHLQMQMNEKVTSDDVYVFTFTGNENAAWTNIQRIISCLLDANYVSYHILDKDDIRSLFKDLMNVHEFSVNSAMLNSFTNDMSSVGIIPIKIVHADGTEEKLNMTSEERLEKSRLEEEEKRVMMEEKKNKKRKPKRTNKKSDVDGDEEIHF